MQSGGSDDVDQGKMITPKEAQSSSTLIDFDRPREEYGTRVMWTRTNETNAALFDLVVFFFVSFSLLDYDGISIDETDSDVEARQGLRPNKASSASIDRQQHSRHHVPVGSKPRAYRHRSGGQWQEDYFWIKWRLYIEVECYFSSKLKNLKNINIILQSINIFHK